MSDETQVAKKRFEALLAPHHNMLRGYVHRLVGHPDDAEDLIQDIAVRAIERLDALRSDGAFKSWLFKIATSTCIDHLRKQKRWRPYSQSYYEKSCEGSDELRGEVVAATRDPQFAYDAREHISFCFSCVGRSLEPEQAAALVLREVLSLSNREAADALGVTESVLRHRLSDGRKSMEQTFEGLCSLVNKKGVCWQCKSFRGVTAEGKKGPTLPVLNDGDAWQNRLTVVRDQGFVDGRAAILHNLMFRTLSRLENESD